MKNFYFNLLFLSLSMGFFSFQANAQAPQSMSYQSVIRNSSNLLLANTQVGIKISVLQGSSTGNEAYVETQTATTNANGLVSLQIGAGAADMGTFSEIDWANGPYFIKTEIDPTGGSNYSITGTQQMASVPYALYAAKSGGTVFETTADDATAIHNTNAGNVGIGTDLPYEKLDVAGNARVRQDLIVEGTVRIPSGNPEQGKVLMSDFMGNATWQTPAPSVFEPTIDMPDAIHNTNPGYVGIGTDLPSEKLDVAGNVRVRENLYVEGNSTLVQNLDVNQNLNVNQTLTVGGFINTLGDSYVGGTATANSFVKDGGTSSQFLMADGSVSTGTTGPQGPQGEPGPIGDMGMPGPEGLMGPIGEKGDKGDNGIDGLQGPEGPVGPQGPAPDLSGYATTTDVTNLQSTVINNQIQSDNLLAQTQYLNNEIYDLESSLYAEVIRATTAEEALDSKIYFRDATDFPGSIYSSNPGNVGIGTDLPSEKLDVAGNLKVRENAMIQGTATANSFVKDGGTSSQFLMADGSVSTGGASGTNAFETTADDANAIHNTNAGNVGIGTDLPSEKLDVAGNLKVRQNATVSGTATASSFVKEGGTSSQYLMADGSTSTGAPGATVTLGAIATTSNANGATIEAGVLNLAPANASFGGVVTTGAQTIGGAKTFVVAPILSTATPSQALFSDANKNVVSNAVTGIGNVVMSTSPTLTGTITAASQTLSGTLGVGISNTHASAKLEVNSTTQGFLPPRMTYAQRNAIISPAVGLIIYCNDCGTDGGEPQFYNGWSWRNLIGDPAKNSTPTITTNEITSIDITSANSGGNISSDGGDAVTERFVGWSSSPTAYVDGGRTSDGVGIGTFTSAITGLRPNTTYYVTAYAYNRNGWGYGNQVVFTTNAATVPTLTTTPVTSIVGYSASSGGNISSEQGATVTARGVCWSTSTAPTVALATKTIDGAGAGAFTSPITGLAPNTTYYLRAYATNSVGTAYGTQVSFRTLVSTILPSVTICTQVWTTKNLDVTTYSDGTVIPQVTDATAWAALTTGAWCYYANTTANGTTYGKLYNWYAVAGIYNAASSTNSALRKKLAPIGWHIPSDAEWTTLTTCLGGVSLAGGSMKESGTSTWNGPNAAATNSSGFTARGGGYRSEAGVFSNVTFDTNWWSSTEVDNTWALYLSLWYNNGVASRLNYWKKNGYSVRCVRD